MKINIQPHSPLWAHHFLTIKSHLTAHLTSSLHSPAISLDLFTIEHVGSTSIPGLHAKPVLDIDIIAKKEHVNDVRRKLVELGYIDLGILGLEGRWVMREPGYGRGDEAGVLMGNSEHETASSSQRKNGKNENDLSDKGEETNKGEAKLRMNTYVMEEGCSAVRNHLDTKRVLLANEDLRQEYGDVKMRLAAREVGVIEEYVKGKNEICQKMLERAGWSEEEREVVRRHNS